jgi:2-amino-4-hydroxy-6-hydroxymethyldihydropteridine diphosphokinase
MPVVYLGLGSNLGNREANLRMAIRAMTRLARVAAASSLYQTTPVGSTQHDFYNAVVSIETGLSAMSLLRFLKGIEEEIGRRPGGEPGGPRPIDIDILLYGDEIIEEANLAIPHPRMAERSFVLVPLAEIGVDARHPGLDQSFSELARLAGEQGTERVQDRGWDGVADKPQGRVRI